MSNKKTYILRKDLPDAKAGTELILEDGSYRYNSFINGVSKGTLCYYRDYVENSPEWFELMPHKCQYCGIMTTAPDDTCWKKPPTPCPYCGKIHLASKERIECVDWEILEYMYEGKVYTKNNLGEFSGSISFPIHKLILHPDDMKTIHKVKRMDDGISFYVKEKVGNTINEEVFTIEKIDVSTGECYLMANGHLLPLRNAKKVIVITLPKEACEYPATLVLYNELKLKEVFEAAREGNICTCWSKKYNSFEDYKKENL